MDKMNACKWLSIGFSAKFITFKKFEWRGGPDPLDK